MKNLLDTKKFMRMIINYTLDEIIIHQIKYSYIHSDEKFIQSDEKFIHNHGCKNLVIQIERNHTRFRDHRPISKFCSSVIKKTTIFRKIK